MCGTPVRTRGGPEPVVVSVIAVFQKLLAIASVQQWTNSTHQRHEEGRVVRG